MPDVALALSAFSICRDPQPYPSLTPTTITFMLCLLSDSGYLLCPSTVGVTRTT